MPMELPPIGDSGACAGATQLILPTVHQANARAKRCSRRGSGNMRSCDRNVGADEASMGNSARASRRGPTSATCALKRVGPAIMAERKRRMPVPPSHRR